MLLSALTITILAAATNDAAAFAFVPSRVVSNKDTALYGTKVGIFFGTSTGSTQEAADIIAEEFGDDVASSPIEIDEIQGSVAAEFAKYDALVVGTPTWNTGADVERSGTGWDEIYYGEMADLNIAGKKVAVFGLGDSVSYSENYADASGELYDVFESLGCSMLGATSTDGYLHEASKAIRGDKFCGLLLDEVNQEELTGERVKNWVAALIGEGLLSGAGTAAPAVSVQSPAPVPQIETEVTVVEPVATTQAEEQEEGFLGHYNSLTDETWWVGNSGRSSFVTNGPPEMHSTLTKTNTRMSP
jgi:flavodoxin I